MKKLMLLIISTLAFAMISVGQVRTLSTKVFSEKPGTKNYVTYKIDGGVADTLTVLQDTLQIPFLLNKDYPVNYYANIVLDTIAGADTTVTVNVYGKMFESQSYTLIETATSAATTARVATVIESMVDPDYTYGIAAHNLVGVPFVVKTDTTGLAGYPADSLAVPAITFAEAAQTITPVPSIKPYYRYLMFELIISGDDSVGKGIKLDEFELYISKAN